MGDNMEKLVDVMSNQLDRLDSDELCKDTDVLQGLVSQTEAITSIAKQMVDINKVKVEREKVLLEHGMKPVIEGHETPPKIESNSNDEMD